MHRYSLLLLIVLLGCTPAPVEDPDGDDTSQDTTAPADTQSPGDTSTSSDTLAPGDTTPPGDTQSAQDTTPPDLCASLAAAYVEQSPAGSPPWGGTAWISNDLIRETDPTSFVDLSYQGQGTRTMFDRRSASWETVEAHLFDATFGTAPVVLEIQVNPEFSSDDAEALARKYAPIVGRMPAFLFADLQTVSIQGGNEAFGGGNNNLLIHALRADQRILETSIEEVVLHELAHTSIDAHHRNEPLWLAAQDADGIALSDYARDFPEREDLAETLGPYLAQKFRAERVDAGVITTIRETIPNRLLYFDCMELSMDILP